jgi:hypothetical protein
MTADYVRNARRWTRVVFDGDPDTLRTTLQTEAVPWGTQVFYDSSNSSALVSFVLGGNQLQLGVGTGGAIYIPNDGTSVPEVHYSDEGDYFSHV